VLHGSSATAGSKCPLSDPPAGGQRQSAKSSSIAVTRSGRLRHLIDVSATNGEIYRKHADDLTRFAAGLVGPSQAADVVSEAVLNCLRSRRWSEVDDKRAYLYRSVINQVASHHRSSQRRTARERLVAQPERVESPEVRPEVLDAVFQLSIRQRAVVFLFYWEDLDIPTIADLLKISQGSVRRHLARGKIRLKEALHADD